MKARPGPRRRLHRLVVISWIQTFRSCLKRMAGTTRLELATSAVTVQRPEVTSCNFTAPIATLGALRNPRELLLHPNCTQIADLGFRELACFMAQHSGNAPRALIPECGYDQLRRRATSRGNGPSSYAPSDTLSVLRRV